MTVTTTTCVVFTCDGCGDGWQHDDDTGRIHFASTDEALADLLKDRDDGGYGWKQFGDELLCHVCTERRTCHLEGHDWTPWRDCLCGGRVHEIATEVRYCARCAFASEQRTRDGATEVCRAPEQPLETSRGARLVQHLRNHNLFIEQRPEYASYPPPDMPLAVVEQVHAAAELIAQIDAALPDDFYVR